MERTTMAETKNYRKASLIDDITASTTGYSCRQVGEIVDAMLYTIRVKIASGPAVTLTGFGTFRQTQRGARTGANIRTGEKIAIPAQSAIRFTLGANSRQRSLAGRQRSVGSRNRTE
jgi:DNA-binding protein HU-beta